ncbi:uncharacterized protein LOC114251056 [Bombyx mandarina]|uniref:Monocarboxylate transporter n=2 Tax=Bombyx TaxID=7090 RepID=A0A8R2HQ14_BOMMO|nr:uncharacterized protein LOC101739368 [Bombyx mori]XP_028041035.1 uncharacterized protein LOC114251056 [Bombyx mandarina]
MPEKQNFTKKSILVTPSRVVNNPDEIEGGEETEIAAQISVPQDGGWGWVVVIGAFFSILIMDGVVFTFGSLLNDMANDLKLQESLVNLINSIAVALYFVMGPLASALINRFGFRACMMTGSVICTFCLFCSYFITSYLGMCIFYGAMTGFGCCLINMSSSLVVGFYFEKLRSIALSVTTTGSSIGIMIMFPINSYLVKLGGWRLPTLIHSGLFGLIFYFGMTFRPLLSLTVVNTSDDPTRTVTYLPSISTASVRRSPSRISKVEVLTPTATERLFGAVSNANFPTAAAVVEDNTVLPTSQAGPSTLAVSKITLKANSPQGGISRRQLQRVRSAISSSVLDKTKRNIELTVHEDKSVHKGCCGRLFHWESHDPQLRPLYRDDAFYDGKLKNLPVYQKSMLNTTEETKTGLEYQLAVSRAVTTADLQENKGLFTTAARRILATMMDPKLLKRCSFLLLCTSGMLTYLGYLVPYVFIQNRNENAGIAANDCRFFVSAIAFANTAGRLALGFIAYKVDPLKLYFLSCTISGVATICSNFSFDLHYQYLYCCIFGFSIASVASLRCMIIVNIYGLDKLTNGTGIILMFQGIGSLVSTPVASVIKKHFGYSAAFYVAGSCLTLSGLCLLPLKNIAIVENRKIENLKRNFIKTNT